MPGETDERPYIAVAPNKADAMALLPLGCCFASRGARVELLLSKKNYGRIIKWVEGIGASHLLVVKPETVKQVSGGSSISQRAIAATFSGR